MRKIEYVASKTGAKLHASMKTVRGFKGPVGNGKSVTCIQEGLRLSYDQWPNSEGIRKSRAVIVRNTNPELRTTTLNTWKQWVPETICRIVMHPVITGIFKQNLTDGTRLELEVYFLAMDTDDDVKKLLSLESTWIFLNEAKELPYTVVKASRERIGRYPSAVDGYEDVYEDGELVWEAPKDEHGNYAPCKRKALIMDTNPPDDDHWWYQLAEDGCLRTAKDKEKARSEVSRIFEFFDGPSPLLEVDGGFIPNPNAENIAHLPGGYEYYLDMIAGNTPDHINVMVLGNYGIIKSGRPVYSTYNDSIHCPRDHVKAIKGLPICFGWDFGLTPAFVVGQLTPEGQMRIIAELWTEELDVRAFARDLVKPFLQKYFSDFEIGFSFADPSGNNRGEGEGKSAIRILNDDYVEEFNDEPLDMGFFTEGAPTNDPTNRIDAVSRFLNKMVSGEPGYLLNKACRLLRKAKNGAYCYKRVAVAGAEERFRDKPDKNKYSHTSDAEQYLALGFVGGYVTAYNESFEDDDDYSETDAMGY